MKKLLLVLLALAFTVSSFAQEKTYTFEFNNVTLNDALLQIEQQSSTRLFFAPEWINDSIRITGRYSNQSIEQVLTGVLRLTDLNYYIDGNRIILIKNSVIYDELAADYFTPRPEDEKIASDSLAGKPVFYREHENKVVTEPVDDVITLIGKENRGKQRQVFTISGVVTDSKTGKALSNVNIDVPNQKISTVTDSKGFFSVDLTAGLHVIETDSYGHKKITRKIVVYDNGTLNFKVEETIILLDEVIVNTKAKDNLKTAVTGVISLDVEGIKNVPLVLGERDIFKVATTLPGIKTVGEGAAGFNVRGGKEDQNLILLDNALLYNPSHFFGFFSAVNPYSVSKASIYKGSIPAEFGGRLSSVFDITTKNGTDTFTGEGGIGPVTSNLTIGTPIIKGKSTLLVGARATYSDWILKSLDEPELRNSKASFYDAIIKYSHKINVNNLIEATAYYSKDAFSITSDSLFRYSNRIASLKWDHKLNAKNRGSLILTNSDYQFDIDYDNNNTTNSFEFGYKLNETQLALKMNYQYNAKHKISYGIASKLYNISPGDFNPKNSESLLLPITIQKERGLESAAYIADSFTVSEKLLIDIGFRYSMYSFLGESTQRIYEPGVPVTDETVTDVKTFGKNEFIKTYGGFEPRFAARYYITEKFSVKASYDKTFQYMHLLSSNTTQSPTDTWKLSDMNVKPQRAQQFSLGLYRNFRDDELELSVEGYYKTSDNFLDYKVGAELLLNQNIETEILQGEGKAYGVELLLRKSIGKLNGWIGYTYSRTFIKLDSEFSGDRVNDGKYFPANFDKPHDFSIVANYKLTRRYSFSSNFLYQTGRPITYPTGTYTYGNAEYILYSDRNQFRIPDYFRLDLGINIEGNHKIKKLAHSFWNISVYNVLGRANPYSVFFVTQDGKVKGYKTSIFSIPVPTITYNFKF